VEAACADEAEAGAATETVTGKFEGLAVDTVIDSIVTDSIVTDSIVLLVFVSLGVSLAAADWTGDLQACVVGTAVPAPAGFACSAAH
jgi:hypothetical protein